MFNLLSYKTLYNFALSEKVKLKIEKFILVIAMISFLMHLSLIYLKNTTFGIHLKTPISLIIPLQPYIYHFHSS